MKFSTDILPSDTYQDIAFEVIQTQGDRDMLIEITHEVLNLPNINDINKLQVSHFPIRRTDIFQSQLNALFTPT
jgi:hypothetical protein